MLMYKTHRGSDLEKMSMSKRRSQEMVSSTLEAKCVAPITGAVAMAACCTKIIIIIIQTYIIQNDINHTLKADEDDHYNKPD